MIPIIDFQRRSLTGPVMKSDEFDLDFSARVRELAAKYDIKYNPEELIVDDATADAVFKAGVELLADIGLYHMETERVIKFTKEEIEAIAREYREKPGKHTFGRGKDQVTVEYRTSTDRRPPVLYSGAAGVAEEDWFVPMIQSFAQEPSIKAMGICPGLAKLGSIEPKAGTLSEIHVGLWEQAHIKEALRRAGRPDMHCGLLATVSTPAGIMAMIGPGLREAHNVQIGVHIIPEQKIDWSRLILSQFCQERGIQPWQSAMSLIGGLCRNPGETAITMVANLLGQLSYAHGQLCSLFTNHIDGRWSTRPAFWAYSAAARASERNIKVAIGGIAVSAIEAWKTQDQIMQAAASAIVNTASAFTYCWIAGISGFEARLIGEVMDVSAGMERQKANALVKRIMDKVEKTLPAGPAPQPNFPETYDLKTLRPWPAYEAAMLRGKEELARLGVPYR
ncbi:MAG: monomethylamine:corrinoid methyltransferase [Chloroflexi bacterium]|nr:monomethylamine:corrinoid methyltransferase [Chloroflexota bacterium]